MPTRLAVSNIAWPAEEEPAVAAALQARAVDSVEIAPTKVFSDPLTVTDRELESYLAFWADHGVRPVAFQSMLFGRDDLTLFEDASRRASAVERLVGFIELAGRMQVQVLVFGSPKQRRVPEDMPEAEAWSIAVDVFSELGHAAERAGTTFCIEPNPTAYECNFVTTAAAGARLVEAVATPGFGLHLDAAGMALAGDDAPAEIEAAAGLLRHYHASAPQLGELEDEVVDHRANLATLAEVAYKGYVSIEMRPGVAGDSVRRVNQAVDRIVRHADAVGFLL